MFTDLSVWLQRTLGIPPAVQDRLLSSVVVVLALWLIRWLSLQVTMRGTADVATRFRIRKVSLYVVVLLGLLIVGRIWFEGVQSVATVLGLFSAGLAIALKDLVVNFAGWLFILARRPFGLGDRIQIGDHSGDVVDIRVFQFSLLEIGNWVNADQSTGRIMHVPNGKVLSEVLANFSKGFRYIWNEIPVLVTFESDWKKAKELLEEIAERLGQKFSRDAPYTVEKAGTRYPLSFSALTPRVYVSVEDSGVLLTIRYLCSPRERRGSAETFWQEILEAFGARSDVDFAYPTRRFYHNLTEGKADLKPPATP